MKRLMIATVLTALLMGSCGGGDTSEADQLIASIECSIDTGNYRAALDSIVLLRDRYPREIAARKRAITLYNQASLLEAQHEVELTDSLLQATLAAIAHAPTLLEQNLLRNKRDSLQARYDAECGVVRIIRAKISNTNVSE